MKKNDNYSKVLELMNDLSSAERDALIREIMSKMGTPQANDEPTGNHCDTIISESRPQRPDCPHCGAKANLGYIVKDGTHKGAKRYKCKSCNKKFVATTGTAFARTRKSADVWKRFIGLTLSGASITTCQEECGLSRQCAHTWRHKILHVFEENQKSTNMVGTVEVDEMQIPLSYKGNHIQGKFGTRKKEPGAINDMPRKSYKRGSDNKSMSSKDKACVFCMVENGNKAFYAAVPGVGFMNETMLNATVAKHTDKEKVQMLADNYKTTRKYFEDNGYNHTILLSNTSDNPKEHKVEVKDGKHLQHVNAMHRHIRKFLAPYCGVSSKYLSHYMALFVWLKNIQATKQRKTVDKVSVVRAATPDCYITCSQLNSRPAVPQCA